MNDLFLRVLNMSVTGCYVILAVLAARFLLRKAPKKYSYALWAAAGFRLVCPVSFRSVLSLFSLRPFQSARQSGSGMTFIPAPVVYEPVPTVSSAVDAMEQTVSSTLPAVTTPIAPSVAPAATVNPIQTILLIAMILWLAGMAVMATVSIVNYIRLKKELQFAIRLEGNIWQSEAVRSPFILGIWKPKIYIPYGLDDQTRQTILAHEQYHLLRLDHWVKVFAFGILTLHWFNPVCHVAFHLMSRDMEMSCDEHVLAEKSIETTKYSESLLTIATNRRFPAATPLAFAETGVKERMINVLKWRKPRTWVTVTAILVSVLMLVSCVANPRLSEPKVDDVTLLEFPGVKWGATPEEVKEALNITKKQISSEWADEDEEDYFLTVKDITFFGEKVPIAGFRFRRNPGQPYHLWNIQVYLDEAVDMDKMQETLSQAYNNEGTGEYHIRYDIQEGELGEFKRATAATISSWTQSLYPQLTEQIRNDPEYRTYNWVCSAKGTDIISRECLDWMKGFGRGGEIYEEWFEKQPMVTMGIATRTLNALRAETGETDNAEVALTTHNIVELDAGSLFWIMEMEERFLREGAAANIDRSMLEFPGVKWNSTPEEVKEALKLQDDQIVTEGQFGPNSDVMETFVLGVTDISFFGEEVHHAKFTFVRYAGYDTFGLESVELFYPNETDMTVIGETLANIYGLSSKARAITRYQISNGKVQPSIETPSFTSNAASDATKWWPSTAKGTEVLPVEVQEAIISIYADPEFDNPASRDVVLDLLDLNPLAILYCTDIAAEGNFDSPYYTSNKVNFSASYYIDYIQRFGQ